MTEEDMSFSPSPYTIEASGLHGMLTDKVSQCCSATIMRGTHTDERTLPQPVMVCTQCGKRAKAAAL